jgi:uncharacterized protein (DUF362 family)
MNAHELSSKAPAGFTLNEGRTMDHKHGLTRRGFLNRTLQGLAAGVLLGGAARGATPSTRVALSHGESRAENVYEALKRIEQDVRKGLAGKRTVLIKPNMVMVNRQLTSTHVDCMEGILEFLRPLVKGEILVAESSANGPAEEGYDNYGYTRLKDKYRVRFMNLDTEPFITEHLVDERYHVKPVRFSKLVADPDVFRISTAPFKTHDRAVVTLGLKNVAAGALLKDPGVRWGPESKGVTDKPLIHGGPENQGIHFNLFSLAKRAHPHLSVLDGFKGMEHNGPNDGTPVDHRVAVASTDWLAADRLTAELMGFDWRKIGYMVFCNQAGMGQTDPDQFEILGEDYRQHIRTYKPHDTIEQQYKWM